MISSPPVSPKPNPRTNRTIIWAAILAVVIIGYVWLRPKPTTLQRVQEQYVHDVAQLDSAVRQLQRAIVTKESEAELQAAFYRSRLQYKRVEFLTELYNPETAKSINGPNILEVDEADKKVEQPEGLQVIEELLFPYDPSQHNEVVKQVAILVSNVGRLVKVALSTEMTNSHVFDAMRLEVFRLISLGITGFDSPISHHSLPEAAQVLESLQQYLALYPLTDTNPELAGKLNHTFAGAISTLKHSSNFDRFDRLSFITQHANVLSGLLLDAQQTLGIPIFDESRFLSASARTLNDENAFDPAFFVNTNDDRPTPDRVALGKQLFYDPILSGDGKRTCATCHQPDKAFTDGEPKSLAVGIGGQRVQRNAPTLLNAAFQAVQFMDSRVVFLEDQANDVISNATEMHGSLPVAVQQLRQHADYNGRFQKAYPNGVTEQTVKNALASYVRSLTNLNSRVDQYLRGQGSSLTTEEKQGFNLFMGKAQCATCHFYPLFNGTVPPTYSKTESEVLGTPATADNRQLDTDVGKFATTTMEPHKHAFKTPTIRHVAQTGPYMHNGVYKTLEEVVEFYNKGGGSGLGFKLENQTLPDNELKLSNTEKKALIAFMKAL